MADRWRDDERSHWDDNRNRGRYGSASGNRYDDHDTQGRGRVPRQEDYWRAGQGSLSRNTGGYGESPSSRDYDRDHGADSYGSRGHHRGYGTSRSDSSSYAGRGGRDSDLDLGFRGYRNHDAGDDRSRYRSDDYRGRDYRGGERGWMERAGDEVASWFGDDDAEHRRRMDELRDDDRRGSYSRSGYDRTRGRYRDDW